MLLVTHVMEPQGELPVTAADPNGMKNDKGVERAKRIEIFLIMDDNG